MNRVLSIVFLFLVTSFAARAQSTATTTQIIDATLVDVIDLTFTGTGTNTGNLVSLVYTTPADFANGLTSSSQQIRVVSTKGFNVTVKTNAANFTYTGTATTNNVMPVSGILRLMMITNSTGGTTNVVFNSYSTLTATNQNLITNALYGSNQLYSIQYRGMPSFNYPGGTYTINVIYTVTQI